MHDYLQLREAFHFCFLERLLKISDAGLYILKGGVNLRFFFHSPRYSEDMDLDVVAGSVSTLKKNGYKILEDKPFIRSLRTYGIEDITVNDPSKAKHTDTTQRFRLQLVTSAGDMLPTKIEFSRRGQQVDTDVTEKVDPEIARKYKKLAFRCRHYPGDVAVIQKIKALAGRTAVQARDVFDLGILHLGGYPKDVHPAGLISAAQLQKAEESLLSLSYQDYQGQVLEFLDEEDREQYGSPSAWEDFQETVLELFSHES